MAKIRIYELSKQTGIETKTLVTELSDFGLDVKNHMSSVDKEVAERFLKRLENKNNGSNNTVNETKKPENNNQAKPNQARLNTNNNQTRPTTNNNQARPNTNNSQARPTYNNNQARPTTNNNQARPNTNNSQARPNTNNSQARPNTNNSQARPNTNNNQARPNTNNNQARPNTNNQNRPNNNNQARPNTNNQNRPSQNTGKKPFRKGKGRKDNNRVDQVQTIAEEIKSITIGENVTVQDFADKLRKKPAEIIKKLIGLGIMATINQEIDSDTAELIASEFEIEVVVEQEAEVEVEEEEILAEIEDAPESLKPRPCVVTVMGHVDHGKTSLLDSIRHANVISTEAGGITQHIGAYQVERNGQKITFLDTPGHEAFTAMRARGAQVTDIAILVVAADDGVMPQTIEAINHAKAAEVPIIIAVNKIDKVGANPDKVKQELTEYELIPEDWGGDTIFVNVSALKGEGIDDLLEMIVLVSEMAELKANPNRLAKGTVVEAELDKGRGPVATLLIQTGTLNIGDIVVAGFASGRVRAMVDDKGRRIKKAGPSTPVEILGLSDVPEAGDIVYAVEDEKIAKQIISKRIGRKKEAELKQSSRVSLDDLFKQIKEGGVKDLNIIIKADVQGSIEAVKQSLQKLSTDEVRVNPIHGGVGAITESDIMLASASNAIIIGFNVRPDGNARKTADTEKVDLRLYRVIYDAIEDVKKAMSGLLEPEIKEVELGRVEVRQTFKVSKVGTIAGCYVTDGKITSNSQVRIIRDGIVVHEGKMDTLKRFKDDVKEVREGYECGITLEKFNDLREGDVIEPFIFEKIKREL